LILPNELRLSCLLPVWPSDRSGPLIVERDETPMMDQEFNDVGDSYDRVAAEYALRIFGELEHKPLNRQLLDRFAERVQGLGPVCDLGCGPGHTSPAISTSEVCRSPAWTCPPRW
jgi:hypothetical protein